MARAVEPFANISSQELLKNTPRLFGWVRKEDTAGLRSVVKLLDWPWRYMILSTGCLYLYKTSDDQNFTEAVPLTKFRVCDAQEKSKYPWVFKLIHESHDGKTLYFAVDTDFDLKKWKDAITESKTKYCSDTSREDEADGYSTIDEKEIDQAPEPPLRDQSARQRPPAPLPLRPDSKSTPPEPFKGSNPSRNSLSIPPRRQLSDFAEHSAPKPLTLPRPPVRAKPTRPSTMGTFPRSISESSLATNPQGFDKVVTQLERAKLSSPDKRGLVPSSMPSSIGASATPCQRKQIRRGAPDGQSLKEKGREGVLPNSALRLDIDKLEVNTLLENKQGVYIVRKSQTAQSKMALSVWTRDRVRHYVIFHKEDQGYALDPDGPRFDKMEDLIRHYYDYNLPKCDTKFTRPYK